MPKLTIDGIEVEVEDGLNLIQAAAKVGVEVPHFCYHPALSVVSQCRQCLVEVEGVPKIMPACSTFVRDGLVVNTQSDKALAAREATVEFTLINHPLDCPICAKGGECPLQITTFSHGRGHSRFDGPEQKKVRQKYLLSDNIAHDPNRCIMCTRCVRFTDEVTKTGELGFSSRGFRKKIVTFPGRDISNALSGNIIDLCPVGALLDTDALHDERVWYYKFTDTVCPLCSNGCNITVGVDPRLGRVARVRPRTNPDVNEFWICDNGRWGFKGVQGNERIKYPLMDGEQCSWDRALEAAAGGLGSVPRDGVAVLGSALLTNEEGFLLGKLCRTMGIDRATAHIGQLTGEKAYGIISTDPYPNSRGVRDMGLARDGSVLNLITRDITEGRIRVLYLVGYDPLDWVSEVGKEGLIRALEGIEMLIVQHSRLTEVGRMATVVLPGATPYEKDGTFTNDTGRVQVVRKAIDPPGAARADWEIIAQLGRRLSPGSFSYSSPSHLMSDISDGIPEYGGMSHERVGMLGMMKAG